MTDNVAITAGSGTTVATDEIGGVHYQMNKLAFGVLDTAVLVSPTNPFPTVPYDADMGLGLNLTNLRDLLTAQRYTNRADSIANGIDATWLQTLANGGTATSTGGEGVLSTSTATNGSAQMVNQVIMYLPGQVAWFNSAIRVGDTGIAGNTRRWGCFTVSGGVPQDGFYYELSGTTLNAVSVKAGTPTAVAVGSWTKNATNPFTLNTSYHQWEIRFTANSAHFWVDGALRHTVSGTTAPITSVLDFPMALQNINSGNTTNVVLGARNVGMGAFGTPPAFPASPDVIMQNAATATGNGTVLMATGFGTAALQITGTFVGTVTFEGTEDGTNYFAVAATQESAAIVSTTATTPGIYRISVAGLAYVRARISAYTSGNISVQGRTTNSAYAAKFDVPTGNVASGATDSGNPVKVGGKVLTTQTLLSNGQRSDLTMNQYGSLYCQLTDAFTQVIAATVPNTDTNTAAAVCLNVAARNYLYDGNSNHERQRGMGFNTTTGDTGAKTATGNGATQTNVGNKGIYILINMGNVTGTSPTINFKLQASMDGGTTWIDIAGATTGVVSVGNTQYGLLIYPGINPTAAGAGFTCQVSSILPRTWRVAWIIAGTTPSFTITNIQYNYLVN